MDLITFVVYSFPEFAYWFVKILLNYSVISVIHNHVTEKCLHNKKPLWVVPGFDMFHMLR